MAGTTTQQGDRIEVRGPRQFTLVLPPTSLASGIVLAAVPLVVGLVLILGGYGPEPFETAQAEGELHIPILAALTAAFGAYWGLAQAVNTVIITAESGSLRVRLRPLPWPGVSIDPSRVRSFTVRERYAWGGHNRRVYDVRAVFYDGTQQSCLRGLDSEERASSLERTLSEAWSGRVDEALSRRESSAAANQETRWPK